MHSTLAWLSTDLRNHPKMRHFSALLLGGLFLATPVSAQPDYQACEAMQRAKDRAIEDPNLTLAVRKAQLRGLRAAGVAAGGGASPFEQKSMELQEVGQEAANLRSGIGDPGAVAAMRKVQKIEADMAAAGCP